MSLRIVTDSASDLPASLAEKHEIEVIPFVVIVDGQEYYDRETLKAEQLYKMMQDGKLPKTAQVPYDRLKTVFEKYAKQNDSVLYIGFSSALSGTFQTAVAVKNELTEEFPDFDMEAIDSKGASAGQALMAIEAAEMAKLGKAKQEILDRIAFRIAHTAYLFTVDDLVYLQRGGRIGKAAAFFGGLLHIKPLIGLEDGKLVPKEKIRGSKKIYRRMVDLLKEQGAEGDTIAICHAENPEAASTLKKQIEEETGASRVMEFPIGAVLGSHTGPGAFAVIFLADEQ
ncbi:MAG TPA: DegV family protein [Bacillales bacterium]|nr:DegV family protein [Bacillales bacterium]